MITLFQTTAAVTRDNCTSHVIPTSKEAPVHLNLVDVGGVDGTRGELDKSLSGLWRRNIDLDNFHAGGEGLAAGETSTR